ncbi:PLDc N-terminal domain-containing protein [Pseudonocardia sp. RS11V-5]|uniref:SHOCT domain-containing protein n=1 Tax=Pseudonocardia terrae TaxID=2905831 RepID=UPI001E6009E4|nr:SHOCT domain-containing protein [Pseudonocardia terrae]MCE3553217.1 PLDc N-terminal domain-containing protein [Pseudonocardia terrae]
MVLAQTGYPLLDLFWTMLVFFGFVVWFWLLFVIFGDIFRRDDIGGWGKAGWTLVIIVLPILGSLVYLIVEGRRMGERRQADAAAVRKAYEHDVRRIAAANGDSGGPTAQISEAKRLLDQGAITPEEYESLKSKALGRSVGEPA